MPLFERLSRGPYNLSVYVDSELTARQLIKQIAASVNGRGHGVDRAAVRRAGR
jgi:hypothetical protein